MIRAVLIAALALAALPATARAQEAAPPPALSDDDYGPTSRAWNGLAGFVAAAEGTGLTVLPVRALEWSEIGDQDILVLLYPLQRVDPARLQAFVQAGGHVVIADDFGESKEALTRLALVRGDVTTPRASRFHDGKPFAPVATAIGDHPIAAGITEVVTNHPAVLTQVEGADVVIAFSGGEALVVAGERGTGRFVVVSDPSVFINRMLQFPGNLRLVTGILRWLDRGGRARRVVLLRGDVPMYGDPQAVIDDAAGGPVGAAVGDINRWIDESSLYLLTPPAMRILAMVLAALLGLAALFALPVWRRGRTDGRWLRFERPPARDHLARAVMAYDAGERNFLLPATVLRDVVHGALTRATGRTDPLFAVGERELIGLVAAARGPDAGSALGRVYRRLRALPSRSQAAAPWGGGSMSASEFDALHADVAALCRTLGEEID